MLLIVNIYLNEIRLILFLGSESIFVMYFKWFGIIILVLLFPLMGQAKSDQKCKSLFDCEKNAELTSIHRKKISFLSIGINEYTKDAPIQTILPLYFKRAKSIILEANGETGYTGEIVLKVSHKPEYKLTQLKKAEDDINFIDQNKSNCSVEQIKELDVLKGMLLDSK